MFGYDLVGRKIYVAFGDNIVCSLEKLNIKPESINIQSPKSGFQKANMVIANVYKKNKNGEKFGCKNEFTEEIIGTPYCDENVSRLEDIFCTKEFWVAEKEKDLYEKGRN